MILNHSPAMPRVNARGALPTSMRTAFLVVLCSLTCVANGPLRAAPTDIATSPLASSSSLSVLPNILFTLDDSGSMGWDFLPDYVNDSNTCKTRADGTHNCMGGEPPYNSGDFNGVYYNPSIRYFPAMNSDGTSMTSFGSPWTNVKTNGFSSSSSTINLTNAFPHLYYCDSAFTVCKRNGIAGDTPNPFQYKTGETDTFPNATYNKPGWGSGNPHYFKLMAREHCSDTNLTTCTLSDTPASPYTNAAPVRFCKSIALAQTSGVVSGSSSGSVNCQAKFTSTYKYPRYGKFQRVDIIPSVTSYTKAGARTDCAGSTCTYAEEMTNFANWYAYSRTRMMMMKTTAGRAFAPIDDRFRVGFVTINPGSPVSSTKYLQINPFTSSHKSNWYSKLYAQNASGGTPLRQALSRAGRHYAGKMDGINQSMSPDPMQYSCQQNFLILTTDGYWNGSGGQKLDGSSMGNEDSTAPRPFFDGPSGTTTSDTLADAAYYYYQTDLRTTGSVGALGLEVAKNNVPVSESDTATWQHMTTFTLGLVDGLMTWTNDYDTAKTGDYYGIATASSTCSWVTGTCNWPKPAADTLTALDDLWHGAVNGRGKYYNARDPASLADGLNDALNNLKKRDAAGAAAATSTPNVTPSDRSIFLSSYTTIDWFGNIEAQLIDPATGDVLPTVVWNARDQLDGRTSETADTRTIYTFSSSASNKLKPFRYTDLSSTEQGWFADRCTPTPLLTQCPLLTGDDLTIANSGEEMVDFLRGHTKYEDVSFRARKHILGDTVNSVPLFIAKPKYKFTDEVTPSYTTWSTSSGVAGRTPALYVGANDGMLHAFDAGTGDELWAYVPRMVMPNMYKLAEENYASKHIYLVDGTPVQMDVFDGSDWRTIMVGGLNSGGRGYYALDVTNPTAPKALWEICHDSSLCAIHDADMGLSYGKAVITKRAYDGKWVVLVTSGYNNVSPGDGKGYLYVLDAVTGAILEKQGTGVGSTTTPSGLGKIAVWADNFNNDNTGKYVYGGDMEGNLWRFDLTTSSISVLKLGIAKSEDGKPQPITTAPALGLVKKTHRAVFFGTGRYLGPTDLSDPATHSPAGTSAWQQSIYAVKDAGEALGTLRSAGLVEQQILGVTGDELTRSVTTNDVDWGTANGWYVDLPITTGEDGTSEAERVNVDPQLFLGTLVVAANVPGGSACTIGGEGWLYQFDFTTGSFIKSAPGEAVANKQSGALIVGFVVYQLPGGTLVGQVGMSTRDLREQSIHINSANSGRRVTWREITQ